MRLLAAALAVSLIACGPTGDPSGARVTTAGGPSSPSTPPAPSTSDPNAPPSPSTPSPSAPPVAPPSPALGPDRVTVPAPTATAGCSSNCLYVDATVGSDANAGDSPPTAFRTLNRAAQAVGPGTTVLVMSGTYTTDGTEDPLTISTSGHPDAWITFAAAPGQHPVIQIPRGPNAFNGIHLPGVAYVIIDGFEIVGQNASITPDEAAANDGTQAVLNHNCIYVDGAGFGSFHPDVPHDIVIRNCTIHGCSAAGIEANAADRLTVAYNHVYDTSWWTVFGTSGIGLMHLTDAPGVPASDGYRNFIVGNLVHGNRNEEPFKAGRPPAIYDGNGIIVDDANHAQGPVGIHDVQGVPYTGRTYIANNVVYGNGGRGIHVFSSAHVDVVANTTYDNLRSSSPAIARGEIDAENSTAVNILDNVAVNLVGKDMNMDDGNRYDFNVWDGARVPVHGPHDVLGPAGLADPAHGDFTPAPSSPALGSATTELAPSLDFLGHPRPAAGVDRGALQVTAAPGS